MYLPGKYFFGLLDLPDIPTIDILYATSIQKLERAGLVGLPEGKFTATQGKVTNAGKLEDVSMRRQN